MEAVLGDRVISVRRLVGGVEADTHAVGLAAFGEVVLRQPRDVGWDDLDRHHAVLKAVSAAGVRSPLPLAVDARGEQAGRPSLVMSLLDGGATQPLDVTDAWLRSLAEEMVAVHATPTTGLGWLPDRVADLRAGLAGVVPKGMTEPADLHLWEQLRDFTAADLVRGPIGLVHKDFWSGNALWQGDRVVGVVDWAAASLGPPEVDVAECMGDLWLSRGEGVARRFADAYRDCSGLALESLDVWLAVFLLRSYDCVEWLPGWNELGVPVTADGVLAARESIRAQLMPRLRD